VDEPFEITERLSSDDLQVRQNQIRQAFHKNKGDPASVLTYLEEAYYFVPVHLGLQLQQRAHYTAALDWFRTVYDYSVAGSRRKISHYLKQEELLEFGFERAETWWLDPLNPHGIASTRSNTYTRFTLLSLVRCLLAFADAEFTRDTSESLPRARTLYMTALELLELPELNQKLNGCDDVIGELDVELGPEIEARDPNRVAVWNEITASLRRIPDRPTLEDVSDRVRRAILTSNDLISQRLTAVRQIVADGQASQPALSSLAQTLETKSKTTNEVHDRLLRHSEIATAVSGLAEASGNDYLHAVADVSGINVSSLERDRSVALPWLRRREGALPAGDGGGSSGNDEPTATVAVADTAVATPTLASIGAIAPLSAVSMALTYAPWYLPAATYSFCIPPNPILSSLQLNAELNLYKIRTCRNIAGDERRLEPYAAPTDTESGIQTIGDNGELAVPGTINLQPTPFRYQVLIERARRLVGLAQQIEAAFLATLKKRDEEYYQQLKARQGISLARAGVRLQDLRVKEAEDGVMLAELQRERAEIQEDHFDDLMSGGLLDFMEIANFGLAVAGSVGRAGSGVPTGGATGASAMGSALGAFASRERRRQQWRFQRELARQDIRIGNQQIRLARGRVRVVGQERRIAELQTEQAEETAEFLANKFTNADLYDWMSGILEGVYSFFLQQATSMARLAENQLAFERQEIPPSMIQADYWEAPLGLTAGLGPDDAGPDRRGLTGSARLLRDVEKLDLYAFETDERKRQLTKTISLARIAPAEFRRFRQTSVLRFNAPGEMFDQDFPGHYLRLIKRVRTSVVALIPPTEGIKATLSTTGLSRVVIGSDGLFQEVRVNRPPESVALSSPNNATGLFELTPQTSEKLFPFESMGVDTAWEFQLPRAANRFDFGTIADVLLTIEYTALNSFTYRQQVVRELGDTISADRPFSFRQELADPFYDLNNPAQSDTPMVVRFQTRRQDFPSNIDELRIQQVVLFFSRSNGSTFEVPVNHLVFTEENSTAPVGGGATSINGIISTRRGNAGSWTSMIGKQPFGEWELALPDADEMRKRFKEEKIEDILFVITYSSRTPAWPT
jgi:hypothetical protein